MNKTKIPTQYLCAGARMPTLAAVRAGALAVLGICGATDAVLAASKYHVPPSAVLASSQDGANVAAHTVDGRTTGDRWSAKGLGAWIRYDLGSVQPVGAVKIAWRNGAERKARFDLQASVDGKQWTTLLASKQSSGKTADLETYELASTLARFVRIVGRGNTENDWNSIHEAEIWPSTSTLARKLALPRSAATASSNDGNLPGNTLDGNLRSTRWAAFGTDEWIEYDLGRAEKVAFVKIAWNKGDERRARFDLQISSDRVTWEPLLTSQLSSGRTEDLETHDFADKVGRYVRILGGGNTQTEWNSIWETEIFAVTDTPPVDFTLDTSVVGKGTITRTPDQPSYRAGSTVVLTAVPDPGQEFAGWSGAATGTTNPLTLTMSANRRVTANFRAVTGFTLNTRVVGDGRITRSPDAASYAPGTAVTVRAVPDEGFVFSGWSGAITGTGNPGTVVMGGHRSITANFRPAACAPVPQLLKDYFEIEGLNPYGQDGCTMVFSALESKYESPKGHGWRNEVKVDGESSRKLRLPLNTINETFQADVKIELSKNSKTIIAQYHAEGTGTIVKVYVSDHKEKGLLNNVVGDGIFDVYVRILSDETGSEEKFALGTVRSNDSFSLSVINRKGVVTVSALGETTPPVKVKVNGGKDYFKFGDYLQAQYPGESRRCPKSDWASCYAAWGQTLSRITFSNIVYARPQ